MASQIDPSKPADAFPADKAELRTNLQAAKDEIEALQGTVLALGRLALQDQVAVPGDLAAAGTPDSVSFLRGDGQWAAPDSIATPQPAVVTISGPAHNLAWSEGRHRNVQLLVDNGNQDCAITLPDSAIASAPGVVWDILSKTTGTVTVQRETNGTINGGASVQMAGLGRAGTLVVQSNAGDAPFARFAGETTETALLHGDLDAAGQQITNAVSPLADSAVTADRDLTLADARQKMLRVDSTEPVTLTLRADSAVDFPPGTILNITRWGPGEATIAAAAGVTINKSSDQKLQIREHDVAGLWKKGPNEWLAFGGLQASSSTTVPSILGTPAKFTESDSNVGGFPSWSFSYSVPAGTEYLLIFAGAAYGSNGTLTYSLSSDLDGALSVQIAPSQPDGIAQPTAGVFYLANPTTGSHTITVTVSEDQIEYGFAVAVALAGVNGSAPFGAQEGLILNSGVAASGRSITTQQDNSLLFTFYAIQGGDQDPITLDPGMTLIEDGVTGPFSTYDGTFALAQQEAPTSGTQSYGFENAGGSDEQVVLALEVQGA